MSLINWNDTYSVRIKVLDNQHKKLVDTINLLYDAMKQGKSNEVLSKIIFDLIAYTKTHFQSEEDLFEKYSYPNKLQHKKEHDDFVNSVGKFYEDFQNKRAGLSLEIMNFLTNWLTKHIKGSDKAYSKFMNEQGIY
ncbi:hemerythrin [Melioribacter roseus P3M-2]|uniref:Hemerythrin n=1 Tax=Melioribacter roseus (strain DSM 23840 / JCM 17771 / VKM B-2668 / P3M-2) TaxID=1191523 RepID=I7A2M0_MELRP|nr:bacteriohemerythrin [Melioribacter roseus]AFN75423.1 hemerythrin [Melioribacter roseus P3M-2]